MLLEKPVKPQRIEPTTGQESVWDYPRPPRVEATNRRVEVVFNGATIVDTRSALRVLETSHPPVFYVPVGDVQAEVLLPGNGASFCEWKGNAGYYTVRVGDREAPNAAWFYAKPSPAFEALRSFVAFYPSRIDSCTVDGELVRAQPGDFYGGWITDDIVGPFKGDIGTMGW